jgi:putative addiction module component (TIGR02574 family)
MIGTLETISRDALVLPADQRVELAYRLLVSIEPQPGPEMESAWESEIAGRIERFDAGHSEAVSATEVFSRLRQIAPEQ